MARIEADIFPGDDPEQTQRVLTAIEAAKQQGWELFSSAQLSRNAQEWDNHLKEATQDLPAAWLAKATDAVRFLPLVHRMNGDHLARTLEQGRIEALAQRGGVGRTADYEMALGLGDYAFLSLATWKGAFDNPAPIYYPPGPLLAQEGAVVTLKDIAHYSHLPFGRRIETYQQTAFHGRDFFRLLPYFLVLHYGDLDNSQDRDVHNLYPPSIARALGYLNSFHPEIKVKGGLAITDECRIGPPEHGFTSIPSADRDFIETYYMGRLVPDIEKEIFGKAEQQLKGEPDFDLFFELNEKLEELYHQDGTWISIFVQRGREWWPEHRYYER